MYLTLVEQFFGANVRNTLLDDIGADLIYIQKLKMAEHHLYGSSRLGVRKDSLYLYDTRFQATSVDTITGSYDKDSIYFEDSAMVDTLWAIRTLTHKRYELSNHLGNVLSTISDRKTLVSADTSGGETLVLWDADVLLAQDYYPFGMQMPGRNYTASEGYRFGFANQEKVDEISGSGNHTTALFWEYDTRLGRRWNQDPKPNPSISNYAAFANNPIFYTDILGDTIIVGNKGYASRVDRNEDGSLVDNLVFMQGEDGTLTSLGELTKSVNADAWFGNLLSENAEEAAYTGLVSFKNKVKQNAKWDYKNLNPSNSELGTGGRREHLLGIAFSLGEDTDFSFDGKSGYRSEDLNNFHYGVVQRSAGIYDWFSDWRVGAAEQAKWDELERQNREEGANHWINPNRKNWGSTWGDNPTDHNMIQRGRLYYKTHHSELLTPMTDWNNHAITIMCFAAGSKIELVDGSEKNIEDINVGDIVFSYNFESKEIVADTVLQIDSPLHTDLIEIVFSDSTHNLNTHDHPYYVVNKGWSAYNDTLATYNYGASFKRLEIGDVVLKKFGEELKEVRIVDIVEQPYRERITYNISKLSNNNNYFVNGILVHNESKTVETSTHSIGLKQDEKESR